MSALDLQSGMLERPKMVQGTSQVLVLLLLAIIEVSIARCLIEYTEMLVWIE